MEGGWEGEAATHRLHVMGMRKWLAGIDEWEMLVSGGANLGRRSPISLPSYFQKIFPCAFSLFVVFGNTGAASLLPLLLAAYPDYLSCRCQALSSVSYQSFLKYLSINLRAALVSMIIILPPKWNAPSV